MKRPVHIGQLKPRMIAMKVTGTGTAAISIGANEGSLVDNGAGDYTITFAEAFKRIPVAVASCQTAGCYAEVIPAAASIQVLVKSTDGNQTATDAVFDLIVLGFDSSDEI